jgi:hypothetical protein
MSIKLNTINENPQNPQIYKILCFFGISGMNGIVGAQRAAPLQRGQHP